MSLSTDDLCRNFQELSFDEKLQLGSTVQTANEFDVFNSSVVLAFSARAKTPLAVDQAHFSIGKTESGIRIWIL